MLKWLVAIGVVATLWLLVLWIKPQKHRDANDPNVRDDDWNWAQFWH